MCSHDKDREGKKSLQQKRKSNFLTNVESWNSQNEAYVRAGACKVPMGRVDIRTTLFTGTW